MNCLWYPCQQMSTNNEVFIYVFIYVINLGNFSLLMLKLE
jgi:hypothetical protein